MKIGKIFSKKKTKSSQSSAKSKLSISDDKRKVIEANEKVIEALKPALELKKQNDDISIGLPNACMVTISKHLKPSSRIFHWVLGKYIVPELEEMDSQEIRTMLDDYEKRGTVDRIGSIVLSGDTFELWKAEYKKQNIKLYKEDTDYRKRRVVDEKLMQNRLNVMRRLKEQEDKRIADEEEKKKELLESEKKKKIDDYINYFKTLNKAQRKVELEWFKKKIVSSMTDTKEEAEELIHKLEIISLAD